MYALFSSSDKTILLNSILKAFYRYGGPILIVSGTIGSVIMLMMSLTSRTLQSSQAIYSMARNISNLFYIYLSLLYFTLALGFDINPSSYNLTYCRFSIYMSFVFEILSPSYLILSWIDQTRINKMKVRGQEQRNRPGLAIIWCLTLTLFWMLFHIHSWFLAQIIQTDLDYFYCYLQSGLYSTLITYYSLLIKVLLVPIFLIIAIHRLMRNSDDRPRPIISVDLAMTRTQYIRSSISPTDRSIILMLIKDMIIYLVFNSLMSVFILYELITQNQTKTLEHIEVEHFIRYVGIFFAGFPFCIVFYTNLFVSSLFRQQVIEFFSSKLACEFCYCQLTNRIHP